MKNTLKKLVAMAITGTIAVCSISLISSAAEPKVNELGNDKYLLMGSYPASLVEDNDTINDLAAATKDATWTSYNYSAAAKEFTGESKEALTEDLTAASDNMSYIDVTVDGVKYRGVKIKEYRSNLTIVDDGTNQYDKKDGGFALDTAYWYEYETLCWKVLDAETGLVACQTVIDSQPYTNTIVYSAATEGFVNGAGVATSDWETSSLNSFLNGMFFNTAFGADEAAYINGDITVLDSAANVSGNTDYALIQNYSTDDELVWTKGTTEELTCSTFGGVAPAMYVKDIDLTKTTATEETETKEETTSAKTNTVVNAEDANKQIEDMEMLTLIDEESVGAPEIKVHIIYPEETDESTSETDGAMSFTDFLAKLIKMIVERFQNVK